MLNIIFLKILLSVIQLSQGYIPPQLFSGFERVNVPKVLPRNLAFSFEKAPGDLWLVDLFVPEFWTARIVQILTVSRSSSYTRANGV